MRGCVHGPTEDVPEALPTMSFVCYCSGLVGAARLLRWGVAGPSALTAQATEAWVDRLDSPHGFRHIPVPQIVACPVGCQA